MFRAGPENDGLRAGAARRPAADVGGDCYAYGLLAMGFADLVVEASLQPYDFMAWCRWSRGPAGSVTDWQGRPLRLDSAGQVSPPAIARARSGPATAGRPGLSYPSGRIAD